MVGKVHSTAMDVMYPTVRAQPAPARWLIPGPVRDVPRFIQQALSRDPSASADTIRAELARRRVGVPATTVAAWMQKLKSGAAAAEP